MASPASEVPAEIWHRIANFLFQDFHAKDIHENNPELSLLQVLDVRRLNRHLESYLPEIFFAEMKFANERHAYDRFWKKSQALISFPRFASLVRSMVVPEIPDPPLEEWSDDLPSLFRSQHVNAMLQIAVRNGLSIPQDVVTCALGEAHPCYRPAAVMTLVMSMCMNLTRVVLNLTLEGWQSFPLVLEHMPMKSLQKLVLKGSFSTPAEESFEDHWEFAVGSLRELQISFVTLRPMLSPPSPVPLKKLTLEVAADEDRQMVADFINQCPCLAILSIEAYSVESLDGSDEVPEIGPAWMFGFLLALSKETKDRFQEVTFTAELRPDLGSALETVESGMDFSDFPNLASLNVCEYMIWMTHNEPGHTSPLLDRLPGSLKSLTIRPGGEHSDDYMGRLHDTFEDAKTDEEISSLRDNEYDLQELVDSDRHDLHFIALERTNYLEIAAFQLKGKPLFNPTEAQWEIQVKGFLFVKDGYRLSRMETYWKKEVEKISTFDRLLETYPELALRASGNGYQGVEQLEPGQVQKPREYVATDCW